MNERQDRIARLDEKLIKLLNQRGRLVARGISESPGKGKSGYDPVGEEKTVRKILRANTGPLPADAVSAVYREIISACRELSGWIRIAYLGPEATFTHAAARKQFGSAVEFIPAESIGGVFREVENDAADYGVVPIENSLDGAVTYTLDSFMDSPLQICSEVFLRVSHSLLSTTTLPEIERIYSHPQVFGQCRSFIQKHLSRVELREAASTARAAELAARDKKSGALANSLAASVYGLKILKRNMQDNASNMTRFLVIGRATPPSSGKDRTSILFSLPHRSGSLHDALNAFRVRGINLTKIESRPSRKKAWEYYFFVDLEGHRRSKKVREALEELEETSKFIKLLGSYPIGII
ncbi:MAG: prephenate dehydratase [Candidatus Auribacterota bacterium]|nr:prephenate dehydratase [Candidatus Auribacterota bacterium]